MCLLPGRSTDRNRFPDSDGLHAAAAEDANFGVYESADATPVAFGIVTTDRGDVRELTDASGMPFAFYSYDAYGNPTAKLSAATSLIGADVAAAICSSNVVRYAGYVYDQESGLYYLSARYYDPSTASFLTKDPANADGEESPYQYCGGDPVGKVNPSGTSYRSPTHVTYLHLYYVDLLQLSLTATEIYCKGAPDGQDAYFFILRAAVYVDFKYNAQVQVRTRRKVRLDLAGVDPRLEVTATAYRHRKSGYLGKKTVTISSVFSKKRRSKGFSIPNSRSAKYVSVRLRLLVGQGRRRPSERNSRTLTFRRS